MLRTPMSTARLVLTAAAAILMDGACSQQLPVGIPPLTIYVVDATDLAPLCDATVMVNGVAAQEGEAMTIDCYYLPTFTLAVGAEYTVTASDPGYLPNATMGTVANTGSKALVQLQHSSTYDAGYDAPMTTDAPVETSTDATTDVAEEEATD
jgi:hypothetical protein